MPESMTDADWTELRSEFERDLDEYMTEWEATLHAHIDSLTDADGAALSESDWSAFTGPKGGKGWKNSAGTMHYGDKPPTAGETPDSTDDGKADADKSATPSKARAALDFARSVPAAVVQKIKTKVAAKYDKLEQRYGSRWSKAIIVAALAGIPVPAPGASFAMAAPVVALAELHRMLSGSGGARAAVAEQEEASLTDEQVQAAARELIDELTAEFSKE